MNCCNRFKECKESGEITQNYDVRYFINTVQTNSDKVMREISFCPFCKDTLPTRRRKKHE